MHMSRRIAGAIGLVLAGTASVAVAGSYTGPSSSQSPYVTPTAADWSVISLLTVGDSPSGGSYPMVGIPDGLGAVAGRVGEDGRYRNDHRYMTVFMNHELGNTVGIARAHGQKGAFVSQWTIDVESLEATKGEDLIKRVYTWNAGAYADTTGSTAFTRFCSADFPGFKAFYNERGRKGYDGIIFMNGEEAGNEGRSFANLASGSERGTSYQLPFLGRFSWENAVAHPNSGDKTIVIGLDDSTPGQVYVYVGDKQSSGNPVERAGLANGRLFGVQVTDGGANYGGVAVAHENHGAIAGKFTLVNLSDVATGTGAVLQTTSVTRAVTEFARPEDGAWDPTSRKDFYFVTTGAAIDGVTQTARLYRLRFNNLNNPTGGKIELVTDSANLTGYDSDVARSFDNLTVSLAGKLIVQEDPGNSAYIAKTWQIDPDTGEALQIFESDRSRFVTGAANFLTLDEESSGVIEVTKLLRHARWTEGNRRYYLGDLQAHYPNGTELVEGGQLYLLESERRHWFDDGDREDDRD